ATTVAGAPARPKSHARGTALARDGRAAVRRGTDLHRALSRGTSRRHLAADRLSGLPRRPARRPYSRADQIASTPPEQPFDIRQFQLDIRRPAVVALAGVRRRFHLAQERVHLFRLEPPPRAHRA